jgi:cobalt/nickel transport system permease protein
MFIISVYVTGISRRVFGRLLLAEGTFLLLTTIGVVLSVSLTEPHQFSDWAWRVGPVWISTSIDALYQAANLIARALGAAAAMNFVALSTPLIDLIALFRRWHIPVILIDVMTLIYRFIFVLLESLNRIYQAQDSRLGYHTSYFRAMNSAALLGSRLFIDAFQRSRHLQIALESRGYDGGDLRVLPTTYTVERKILWIAVTVVLCMALAWIAV